MPAGLLPGPPRWRPSSPRSRVIEPVSGSLAGLIIYHERLNAGPGQVVVELAACAAAAWGIARLAGLATPSGARRATGQPMSSSRFRELQSRKLPQAHDDAGALS